MSPQQIENDFVIGSRRAVEALGLAVDELAAIVPKKSMVERAIQRGHFRPDEEVALLAWFGRFLTIRNGLWEVLGEVSRPVGGSVRRVLDLAVDGRGFDPIAPCGAPTCPESLIEGEGARDAIRRSYR